MKDDLLATAYGRNIPTHKQYARLGLLVRALTVLQQQPMDAQTRADVTRLLGELQTLYKRIGNIE